MSKSTADSGIAGGLLNVLAVLLVVLACAGLGVVALVFAMPDIVPPDFRAPTEPPTLIAIPTATFTPEVTGTSLVPTFPSTWTPQFTPTDTPTRPPTDTPTVTPTNSNTPTRTLTPTKTFTPSATPTPSKTYTLSPTGPTPTRTRTQSPYAYVLQNNRVTYIANWTNTAGCNWLGIAGQVFDLNGRAVQGLYVHLEGGGYVMDGPTGSKPMYGAGGYELFLADHVFNSTDTYKVQLRDGAGNPLSNWYAIPTFEDCTKNLILVNFTQDH